MISAKSSADTARFTFLRTLRKSWILPFGLFAVIMSQFVAIFILIDEYKYNLKHTPDFVPEDFMAQYKFVLIEQSATNYGFATVLIQAALIMTGVLLAVQIFKFVASKKMVNVYYSIGMTRANLFLSKYFAGAVLLFTAISLPFAVSVCANAAFFGGSYELYISAFGYWLNYLVICFFCYNVTAIVLSCVGSVIEAAVYTGVLLVTPAVLKFAIEKLMVIFLYGAPYNGFFNIVGVGNIRATVLEDASFIDPLAPLFYGDNPNGYQYILRDITDKTSTDWTAPSFKYAIAWGIVSVLLIFAGMAVFKKRKAEFSGFLGVCKPLTAVCTYIVGMTVAVYLVRDYTNASTAIVFAVGFVALLAAYSAAQLVLFRSFKSYFKKLYRVLIYFAVFAAFCLVFISGLFGYSTRIPEASQIKSAAVSTGTANNLVRPNDTSVNYYYYSEFEKDTGPARMASAITLTNYSGTVFPGFNTAQDIELIRELHGKLIEQRGLKINEKSMTVSDYMQRAARTQIVFHYELKDGSTFIRKYDVTTYEVLAALADLQNREIYREFAARMIEAGIADDSSDFGGGLKFDPYNDYSIFADQSQSLGLVSGDMFVKTELSDFEFGSEKRNALLAAYCNDIREGRGHIDLRTDKPPIGYIYYYTKGDDSFLISVENDSEEKIVTEVLDAEFVLWNYNGHGLPIYEDMTSTVAFLTENDLISSLSSSAVPVKASICRFGENGPYDSNAVSSLLSETTSQFAGALYYNDGERLLPDDVIEYTDAADIAAIADNTLYYGSLAQDGWYVALTYENGAVAFGFIPSQYLPAK